MEAFFIKVKTVFQDCHCELDEFDYDNETIIFTPSQRFYGGMAPPIFKLEKFFDAIDKLVDATPELGRKIYIDIMHRSVALDKHFNMFHKQIPHFLQQVAPFSVKRGGFTEVVHDFMMDIDRESFVEFINIQIVFTGINDV